MIKQKILLLFNEKKLVKSRKK